MFELLENIFRISAIAGYAFTAAIVSRDGGDTLCSKLGVTTCLLIILYLLVYIPGLFDLVGYSMIPLVILCHIGPVFIWLFCLSMFDDMFKITKAHIAAGVLYIGSVAAMHLAVYAASGKVILSSMAVSYAIAGSAGSLSITLAASVLLFKAAIAGHLCFVAWSGRGEDLVEERRRFRTIFVSNVSAAFLWMVGFEGWMLIGGSHAAAPFFKIGQTALQLGIIVYMLWHLTKLQGEWLFGVAGAPAQQPKRRSLVEDRHDLDTLSRMADQDALLEQGLSISKLAEATKMPEHKLRRIINEHLGYRNFADYLNHHRIMAAKTRLAVVSDRHVPILTMAMDLGYGSLGPFNRAFKERAGMTPTEYRKKTLADC